jgi:transposase-like protein
MAGMRRTYTEKERLDLISLVKAERATVREAAEQVGVTLSTAYKWMRDGALVPSRGRARSTPTFVRVLPSGEADVALSIRVGAAEIQVRRDFDADVLRAVVQALGGAGT